MKTATITKVESNVRPWSGGGRTIYYRVIELDNGDVGSIGTKEENPSWLSVGSQLSYTIEKDKIKRQSEFKGGGFKKKNNTKEWSSISTMFKLNALECGVEVESYREEISRHDATVQFLSFLTDVPQSYRQGIDKWGVENEHLIVRMGITKRVAQLFKVDKDMEVSDIVDKCNDYLKWVNSPL